MRNPRSPPKHIIKLEDKKPPIPLSIAQEIEVRPDRLERAEVVTLYLATATLAICSIASMAVFVIKNDRFAGLLSALAMLLLSYRSTRAGRRSLLEVIDYIKMSISRPTAKS